MENEKLTQCQRILRHLRDYGYITAHEAVTEYGEKTSYAVYALVGSEGK